jgi:hypothetical protein
MELIFRRVKVVWTFRCLPVISQFLVKLPRLGFLDSTCCGSSSSELSLSSSNTTSATGQSQFGTERDVPHRETFERVQFTSLSSSRASPYTIACAAARSIQVFNTRNYAAFALLS